MHNLEHLSVRHGALLFLDLSWSGHGARRDQKNNRRFACTGMWVHHSPWTGFKGRHQKDSAFRTPQQQNRTKTQRFLSKRAQAEVTAVQAERKQTMTTALTSETLEKASKRKTKQRRQGTWSDKGLHTQETKPKKITWSEMTFYEMTSHIAIESNDDTRTTCFLKDVFKADKFFCKEPSKTSVPNYVQTQY